MKEKTRELFVKLFRKISEKNKLLIRGWVHDLLYDRKELLNDGKLIECIIKASDKLKMAPFEVIDFIIDDSNKRHLMSFLPYVTSANIRAARTLCHEFKPYLNTEKKRIEAIASLKQYWRHNKVPERLTKLQTNLFIECFN